MQFRTSHQIAPKMSQILNSMHNQCKLITPNHHLLHQVSATCSTKVMQYSHLLYISSSDTKSNLIARQLQPLVLMILARSL
jgi:hypothetical protein